MPDRTTAAVKDQPVEAVVTVTEAELPRIHELAKSLAGKGFSVSNVLESSGLIAGSARPGVFDSIRNLKGVEALEAAGSLHISPPDSDVQ
jgi:hypothetical protein